MMPLSRPTRNVNLRAADFDPRLILIYSSYTDQRGEHAELPSAHAHLVNWTIKLPQAVGPFRDGETRLLSPSLAVFVGQRLVPPQVPNPHKPRRLLPA